MSMEIRFNRTGAERKALVAAVSEIIGCESDYMGAPGFAYAVGQHIIDRNGTLILGERTDFVESKAILTALTAQGFEFETPTEPNAEDAVSDKLSIEVPLGGFNDAALSNLEKLVASKTSLIKKAIGADTLPIEQMEDRLCFPWFDADSTSAHVAAYTKFIHALCEMAKTQKRVTAKEKPIDSEKYAFRCFLIRLGFIGKEYAQARRILLYNLSGSSSFRNKGAGDDEE